ncbi:MAG: phosphatase PAP2 family protein [Actinomycetota bacterium]|nr:phosphatase PAP2 family protein [Actinomycetota bacterium]
MQTLGGILSLFRQYEYLSVFLVGDQIGYWVSREGARSFVLLVLLFALALVFYLSYRWAAGHRRRLLAYRDALVSYRAVAWLRSRYARQLRWLLRRFTPGEYLGLHLTLGLLAATGCLWLFGRLAEDLLTNDPLVRFDETVATTLYGWATPALTTVFVLLTDLGSRIVLGMLGLLLAVIYGLRRRWLYLGTWLAALAGSEALDLLLKELFARPRPSFSDPLLLEVGYSFPSGHAIGSLVAYGMLAYFAVLGLRSWRARMAVIFGAALLVLLIGFSRMYLGVHYFSDVLAGFAVGGVWLSTLITGMETIRRRKSLNSHSSIR